MIDMERLTALTLFITAVGILLVALALYQFAAKPAEVAPGAPPAVEKVPVTTWKFILDVSEGVGPDPGTGLDANVSVYYVLGDNGKAITPEWTVADLYKIPSNAYLKKKVEVEDGSGEVIVPYMESISPDGSIPFVFVAEANDDEYYRAMAVESMPKEVDKDADKESVVELKMDRIAELGNSYDSEYMSTDGNAALVWNTSEEMYETLFTVKVKKDATTGNPTGVWHIKKIKVAAGDDWSTESSKVDYMEVTITVGDKTLEYEYTASDVGKTHDLVKEEEGVVTVTYEAPMDVTVHLYTLSGSDDLTSGAYPLKLVIEDVAGHTHEVPVKVK